METLTSPKEATCGFPSPVAPALLNLKECAPRSPSPLGNSAPSMQREDSGAECKLLPVSGQPVGETHPSVLPSPGCGSRSVRVGLGAGRPPPGAALPSTPAPAPRAEQSPLHRPVPSGPGSLPAGQASLLFLHSRGRALVCRPCVLSPSLSLSGCQSPSRGRVRVNQPWAHG